MFTKFHLDVEIGDAVISPTELIEGRDWFGFAGVAFPKFVAISKEQQFAEKLHAYTLARPDSTNSRVKDLVDMVLLARMGTLDRMLLRQAIATTFGLRGTHPLPALLPEPPDSWNPPFLSMTKECRIDVTLDDALKVVSAYAIPGL